MNPRLCGELQLCSKLTRFSSLVVRFEENYHVWSVTCEGNKKGVGGCDVS